MSTVMNILTLISTNIIIQQTINMNIIMVTKSLTNTNMSISQSNMQIITNTASGEEFLMRG